MSYTIGQFAQLVHLSIDTLRYYEKLALLKPSRDHHQRRVYDTTDRNWIEFIKKLKQTGMPIKQIQQYAILRQQGEITIAERLALLHQQHVALLQQQAEIDHHLQFLQQKMALYQQLLSTTE